MGRCEIKRNSLPSDPADCPQASNSSVQHECGNAEYFCPRGSGVPTRVNPGYYTVGGTPHADTTATERTRHAEIECPPGYYCTGDGFRRLCAGGRYGAERGLSSSSCSGQTNAGTYSTPGATTAQPDGDKTSKCGGPDFYCPVGSSAPLPVTSGYYSAGGTEYDARASQSQCEPGYYCKRGVKRRCAKGRYGEDAGLTEADCTAACHVGWVWDGKEEREREREREREIRATETRREELAGEAS